MTSSSGRVIGGVDAGTECVKAVVIGAEEPRVLGRSVVATRGAFQACIYEALLAALDEAQVREQDLTGLGATGFAAGAVTGATTSATETTCHGLGAFHHLGQPMTLIDIGARDPHVIRVDERGRRTDARGLRRCAMGIGTFLIFTARHLDVNASQLQELAAAAGGPARLSSYCSVFSTSEVLERLREGVAPEAIALGAMHSIAERILEMGPFTEPLAACGGVAEHFPGVLRALETMSGHPIRAVPEPMHTAALGAALLARQPAATKTAALAGSSR